MKKTILYALLVVILLCQFCFIAGLAVAFDVWPYLRSSAYLLFNGQAVENPDEELIVIQDVFGRYGYMDNKGIVRIWPRFQLAGEFHEKLASVTVGGKEGYINANGKMVIPPHLPQIRETDSFIDGRAFVQDGKTGLWGVIDTHGEMATPYSFISFERFSDGMAAVKDSVTEKWGFINADGDLVIPYQFADGSDWLGTPDMMFLDGIACVAVNDEDYVIIDKSGKTVIDVFPQYHEITKDSILYDGEPNPDFLDNYGYAGEGLHWIEKGPGELTFFDRRGTVKFRVEGQTAGHFGDGLCPVKRNQTSRFHSDGEVGYIDLSGRLVIGYQKMDGSDFTNGVAAISDAPLGISGYINTAGQLLWPSADFKISALMFTFVTMLLILFFAFILVKFSQQERKPVFLLRTPYVKHWKVQNQEAFPYLMAVGRKRSFACMIKQPFRRHWRLANQADILNLQKHLDQKTLVWIMQFKKRALWRTASPLLFQARIKLHARNDVSFR